uniref:DNA2/NAM7 helicase-like C-terminal domain-containing protein n=1 Tax=Amphimedon queenslandica TaxID=400682 RepID=A0A1X7SK61_AMPQE
CLCYYSFGRTFELGTVDTFEGKDKDFIILYMCDNGIDASNDLGILNDVCCMITALTRAKKGCYIIGNESYLK